MPPVNATGSRSEYQSFVVRVFFDAAGGFDHGEVTHVSSHSRRSFSTLEEAPRVMRLLISASQELALEGGAPAAVEAVAPDATPVAAATAAALVPAAPPPPVEITTGWAGDKAVQRRVKRSLDIVAAAAALAFLLLPMALIAVAIRLDSTGPVIYRQTRAGRGGRTFMMYKFRSMHADANDRLPALARLNERSAPIFKIRDDPRKTRVGRVLRRFSLDELPQLVNVLKGDLSLVGPRPPLASELLAYEPSHWQRLAVPQGLTGLWQVSGRSLLDFDDMLLLDLEYIRTWSLGADVRILLRTIPTVISGRGAF